MIQGWLVRAEQRLGLDNVGRVATEATFGEYAKLQPESVTICDITPLFSEACGLTLRGNDIRFKYGSHKRTLRGQ